MPYIRQKYREELENPLDELTKAISFLPEEAESGILTYVLYYLMDYFYTCNDFDRMSNALKVLESTKLEYYRKKMANFEDKKLEQNGDV